ncbi:MAG: MBL fold metallo-hydrolase [Acidobacteria bacterium]|nr:MAG: MBL fold metallo-hydrolase [Acidobacteriota bacterium]PYQ91695.1 MAG: MBL fold metallo-hydrolase [Acidobacteriota bacterium]PYR09596.1 MAG: MBL fold metallo-hydrolase [Acidobacteriota bacterium]
MRRWPIVLAATLLSFADARTQTPSRTALDVFFIDVEGGQATLFATPAGESMLVDAGWAGFEGRDAGRIEAAAKQAGVSRLDYLLVTHYHADHVGGVPEIARRLPVRTFVDHGATVEQGERPAALFNAYVDATASGKRLQVKPGDTLPLSGVDVRVVSSGGDLLNRPLPGAGAPNPLCRDFKPLEEDKTENARSVGVVLTYGNFRMIDIGDLTWNKEHDLVCPNNLLGNVDLYLTTHHGLDISGSPAVVHALRPRVAIMNNGAKKGGTRSAWQTVRDSPGLLDFWQLHFAVDAGADHNTAEPLIANLDETTGYGIKVSVQRDGSFTVTNARNGHAKTYRPRS